MVDFLIVGFGLSGIAVARHLEQFNESFLIIDADKSKASVVAAGLYNPVILKRFTMAWNAHEQLVYANKFYNQLEGDLQCQFNFPISIYRKFYDIEEQNNWFVKSNAPVLDHYLDSQLVKDNFDGIQSPYGYGKMNNVGRINVSKLIDAYGAQLKKNNWLVEDQFDYQQIVLKQDYIQYKNIKAKHVIFCEGFGLKQNPFFNYLPLVGSKGCYLIIEITELVLKHAIKGHFFLVPLGNNTYKFGATYEHVFKGVDHDKRAKEFLIQEFEKLVQVDYKVIDFLVGTRPTVIDRRPLVGQHPKFKNLYVVNGMGTRGILMAPTVAKQLTEFLFEDKQLPNEIEIKRFASLWTDRISEKN